MRTLSIAMVTPSFYPILGGLELYVLNVSKELARRGHHVHILTPQQVMKRKMSLEEEMDGVSVHRLPVSLELSYRTRLCTRLIPILISNNYRFDIVHIHGHDHLHSLTALVASKLAGLPVIIGTYGPVMAQSEYGAGERLLARVLENLLTPIVFRLADFIIAKFPSITPWVSTKLHDPSKIGISASGIPKEYLAPSVGDYLQRNLKIEGQTILYVGRISTQKGVQHLIRAMQYVLQSIPKAFLVMVGPDYSDLTPSLLAEARRLGIDKHVFFMGPVYDQEIENRIYGSCDVFVMPSSFEGFSQAIHKAWAQGKPVVATRVGSLAGEVESGVNGLLVEYGDSKALGDAIIRILSSQDLARVCGENGRKKVVRYTYDVLAAELERIYSSVLESCAVQMQTRMPRRD